MVLYLVKDTPPPSKNLYLGISRYAPILKKSKYRHAPFCLGQPSTGMNPDDARAERNRQRAMAFDARAVRAMQALQTTTSDVKEPAVDSDRRYKKRKKKHDSVMRLSDPDVCILPGDPPKEPAADAKEPAADAKKEGGLFRVRLYTPEMSRRAVEYQDRKKLANEPIANWQAPGQSYAYSERMTPYHCSFGTTSRYTNAKQRVVKPILPPSPPP